MTNNDVIIAGAYTAEPFFAKINHAGNDIEKARWLLSPHTTHFNVSLAECKEQHAELTRCLDAQMSDDKIMQLLNIFVNERKTDKTDIYKTVRVYYEKIKTCNHYAIYDVLTKSTDTWLPKIIEIHNQVNDRHATFKALVLGLEHQIELKTKQEATAEIQQKNKESKNKTPLEQAKYFMNVYRDKPMYADKFIKWKNEYERLNGKKY